MSAISAISPTRAAATSGSDDTGTTAVSRVPQKTLGQNDFLKLLATQFKTQDPMKPMEDTAFIAQMAQFSSLEQSKAMADDMSALRADQQRTVANSYLGHRVTVDAGKGATASGDVAAIDNAGTEPMLVINGTLYPLSAVLLVEPGTVTAPVSQPANTGGA
jgi:flagellar basal-body rod modification protein FlgD